MKTALQSSIVTLLGFIIGAINTLVLYTRVLSQSDYGTVSFILATATLLLPFMSLGFPQGLLRFFEKFSDHDRSIVLGQLLITTLFSFSGFGVLLVLGAQFFGVSDSISTSFSVSDAIYILSIGGFMAFFELGFALMKFHLKTRFGVFLKEVFPRILVTLYLLISMFGEFDLSIFVKFLLLIYGLRALIMWIYAFLNSTISIRIKVSQLFPSKEMITYTALVLLGSSISLSFLEIDKVMLYKLLSPEKVATYTVAVFMATTVAIPFRGYLPYLSGKIAKDFSNKAAELIPELRVAASQIIELTTLASLAIIAGIPLIRFILPDSYELSLQLLPVLVLAKWIDSSCAIANTVFQFSDRFKVFLAISAVMVLTLIVLNLFAIPRYGLFGAAYATLGTLSLFSLIKLLLLRKILGTSILTTQTVLVLVSGITAVILFLNVKAFFGYALIALSFFATAYFFTKKWGSK